MQKSLSILFILICFLAFSPCAFGQQNNKTVAWRDLTIDQSTAEDAIKTLGKPGKVKNDNLSVHSVGVWLKPKRQEKVFRILTYKNIADFKRVELSFLENKLVRIYFDYGAKGKVQAKDLSGRYEVDFLILPISGVSSKTTPATYEGQKENSVPKVYEVNYSLLAVTPQSFVTARVINFNRKAFFRLFGGIPTIEAYPGRLRDEEIISRSLAK